MISIISRNAKHPKEHHSQSISQNQGLMKARNSLFTPNRTAIAYHKTIRAHKTNSRNLNPAPVGSWLTTRSKSRCRSNHMKINLNSEGHHQHLRILLKTGRISRRSLSLLGKIQLGCMLLRLPFLGIGANWFRLLSIIKERV